MASRHMFSLGSGPGGIVPDKAGLSTSSGRVHPGRVRPIGAECGPGGTSFRVWAPARRHAAIVVEGGGEHPLVREEDGYFSALVPDVGAGALYRLRLDEDERLYPDPVSRFQPEGPHGPSEVVDPMVFAWTDARWPGLRISGQVLYELHVGTFTADGTWAAAIDRLPHLKALGITAIEMMPIAEFPGRFGWGYDGVDLFAPTRLYGRPDDLRRFIDAAHAIGIGVILDVVYNHLGPDGNFLACFAREYFTDRHATDWGQAINFDGPGSGGVRTFFTQNAAYWIDEYHFDGLRLDATQSVFDESDGHILGEIADAARAAAGRRDIILVGENEPQETRLARPREAGGYGLDALWNDDLHHSAMVALTGRAEAYYEDHEGRPQEFVSAARHGYLFQGQLYSHQQAPRGTPGLDLPPSAMVTFIQNHDQVANSDTGRRIHLLAHPAQTRAVTALMLLIPATPMLFQGQEFQASTPFLYFADHGPDLAELVRRGRIEFMEQFPSVAEDRALRAALPDPEAEATFRRCQLDWSECDPDGQAMSLHRDLIALRRSDAVFSRQEKGGLDGAVIGDAAFALRFFGEAGDDRLLLVNLGRDVVRRSIPEPLLAPPLGRTWAKAWSSEEPRYGGQGTPDAISRTGWRLPAHSAIVLKASSAGSAA